jgi:hypothetical protein
MACNRHFAVGTADRWDAPEPVALVAVGHLETRNCADYACHGVSRVSRGKRDTARGAWSTGFRPFSPIFRRPQATNYAV